jgi:hypothetical protein
VTIIDEVPRVCRRAEFNRGFEVAAAYGSGEPIADFALQSYLGLRRGTGTKFFNDCYWSSSSSFGFFLVPTHPALFGVCLRF